MILADLTSARPGTEVTPLSWLKPLADVIHVLVWDDVDISWLPGVDESHCVRIPRNADQRATHAAVLERLRAQADSSPEDSIEVFTFDRALKLLASVSAIPANVKVSHFQDLRSVGGASPPKILEKLNGDELAADLRHALERAGATASVSGVPITSLRPLLAREYPSKYDKLQNPASAFPGFINQVVTEATARGVVEVEASRLPSRKIWLKSAVLNSPQLAHQQPASGSGERERDRAKWSLSLQLAGWGPFSNIRGALFASVKAQARSGVVFGVLPQLAVAKMDRSAYGLLDKFPAKHVEKFCKLLLAAEAVCVSDRGPVVYAPDSVAHLVSGVSDDFEERLELRIVLELIRRCAVSVYDLEDVAWAIWRKKDEFHTERAATLIGKLIAESKVAADGEEFRVVKG